MAFTPLLSPPSALVFLTVLQPQPSMQVVFFIRSLLKIYTLLLLPYWRPSHIIIGTSGMQSSYNLVADEFTAVNDLIIKHLISEVGLVEDISHYLVTGGGKRIRPLVTLLTAGALGNAQDQRQIQLAASIELLHTATLLHDDVVDMSSLRRGKPTANANWGNASSVLVGDFVYSKAFQLMVAVGELSVMQILSETTTKIAEGEVKQLAFIGDLSLTEAGYFDVIRNKTAQLFSGACESAALVASAGSDCQRNFKQFGIHLGLAFQLVDDYLDYAGDASELGKNVGDDLAEGKLTLPLIEALRITANTNMDQHRHLSQIIEQKDLSKILEVINITQACGALDHTLSLAQNEISQSRDALSDLPSSPYKTELLKIGEVVLSRTH